MKGMSYTELFEILFDNDFIDRYETDKERAVDVIIPLLNSNDYFEKSLLNFYKRIPINRLLIGDGGSTDDSLEILKKFPRVVVFDQNDFKSQGFSIKKLIEASETEYMIYLHSDVFLPESWFDVMWGHREEKSWFECARKKISLVLWDDSKQTERERAYSGSQFGNTKKMQEAIAVVEDDYLQRNEDIIIAELVGMDNYMKFLDTYHYHQMQAKKGEKEPDLKIIPQVKRERDAKWERRIYDMQWKGIVKYCKPGKDYLLKIILGAIEALRKIDAFNDEEAKSWVKDTNVEWIEYIWAKRTLRSFLKKRLGKSRL